MAALQRYMPIILVLILFCAWSIPELGKMPDSAASGLTQLAQTQPAPPEMRALQLPEEPDRIQIAEESKHDQGTQLARTTARSAVNPRFRRPQWDAARRGR